MITDMPHFSPSQPPCSRKRRWSASGFINIASAPIRGFDAPIRCSMAARVVRVSPNRPSPRPACGARSRRSGSAFGTAAWPSRRSEAKRPSTKTRANAAPSAVKAAWMQPVSAAKGARWSPGAALAPALRVLARRPSSATSIPATAIWAAAGSTSARAANASGFPRNVTLGPAQSAGHTIMRRAVPVGQRSLP